MKLKTAVILNLTHQLISRKYFLLLFLFFSTASFAQESAPGKLIICYESDTYTPSQVPNKRRDYLQTKMVQANTSTIEVTYNGVPSNAQPAIQFAIDIWQSELQSSVPIRINAIWSSLEGNSLATTRPTKIYRGFEGAIPDIWYPVSLAEKISGQDLNGTTESDLEITINSNKNWYLGTDGNTPNANVDLVSVVLHEIAHGLGFTSSASITNNQGTLRDEKYLGIYDVLLQNDQRVRLSSFADPSKDLQTQFTSNKIYLYSPSAVISTGEYPKIFAPSSFIVGSSMAHLDESKYPAGNADALMSPYFSMGESVHSLGTILPAVLDDLGWGDNPSKPTVEVYPNPSDGIFNAGIHMPVTINDVDVAVTDLTGKELIHNTFFIQSPLNEIDLSTYSSGIYLLIVKGAGAKIVKKIVLVK